MRTVPENKLHGRVVILWRIHGIACAVAAYAAAFGVTFWLCKTGGAPVSLVLWLPIIAAAIVIAGFVVIFPGIRYRRFRYHISDDEIIIKKGLVIVTHTVVPMIKIQYTDTVHGPVMRALKLAAVRIMTAGGNVEIPGLIPEEAGQMAERITELVKAVRENV